MHITSLIRSKELHDFGFQDVRVRFYQFISYGWKGKKCEKLGARGFMYTKRNWILCVSTNFSTTSNTTHPYTH